MSKYITFKAWLAFFDRVFDFFLGESENNIFSKQFEYIKPKNAHSLCNSFYFWRLGVFSLSLHCHFHSKTRFNDNTRIIIIYPRPKPNSFHGISNGVVMVIQPWGNAWSSCENELVEDCYMPGLFFINFHDPPLYLAEWRVKRASTLHYALYVSFQQNKNKINSKYMSPYATDIDIYCKWWSCIV